MNEVVVNESNAVTEETIASQKNEMLKQRRIRNGSGYVVLPDFACKLLGRTKLQMKSHEPAIRHRRD